MIAILGASASGKTTLLNRFVNKHPEYHKIVTYTTRPMREGEKDGVDYNFINENTFDKLVEADFFVEYTSYNGWLYGTAKCDCESENGIVVLTPSGLRRIKKLGYDVTSIYVLVDRRSCLINILQRGDDIDEAYRRNLSDVAQFAGVLDEVDYVIVNYEFLKGENEVLRDLEYILSGEIE